MLESKVAEMLGQLSDKLGVASAKIWEWSLLQVKAEIVTTVITIIAAILCTMLVLWFAWKYLKNTDDMDGDTENFFDVILFVFVILVVVLDIVAILNSFSLPKLLINPEYAAFQNILEQLGKLK